MKLSFMYGWLGDSSLRPQAFRHFLTVLCHGQMLSKLRKRQDQKNIPINSLFLADHDYDKHSLQVLVLSRSLAVKTLQLEMEYIHAALEDEAVDVAQGTKDAGFLLSRWPHSSKSSKQDDFLRDKILLESRELYSSPFCQFPDLVNMFWVKHLQMCLADDYCHQIETLFSLLLQRYLCLSVASQ